MSNNVYYHGTDARFIHGIATQGFRLGEEWHGRVHGNGLYIATKPETTAYWAEPGVDRHCYAVKCVLQAGIRILWKETDYDKKIIRYLEREFGKKIGKDYAFWKHIPSNKKLSGRELIALVSHLNWMAVSKNWGRRRYKFEDVKRRHMNRFSKLLRQYGYNALGDRTTTDAWDCDEILVYNPSLVRVLSIHRIDVEWVEDDPVSVVYSQPLELSEIKKISEIEEADWQRWLAEQKVEEE